MSKREQAPNLQAVLDWTEVHRPDCLEQMRGILDPEAGPSHTALIFLVTVGFAAGRQYQINHPEQGVNSFHTEPGFMQRPPVKTEKP